MRLSKDDYVNELNKSILKQDEQTHYCLEKEGKLLADYLSAKQISELAQSSLEKLLNEWFYLTGEEHYLRND